MKLQNNNKEISPYLTSKLLLSAPQLKANKNLQMQVYFPSIKKIFFIFSPFFIVIPKTICTFAEPTKQLKRSQ